MPIVTHCTAPGCETLTMGPLCVEHEQQPDRTFVRGRPFVRIAEDQRRPPATTTSAAWSLRTASERPLAAPGRR